MNEQVLPAPDRPNRSKLAALKPYLDKIRQVLGPYILKFKQSRLYTNKMFFYPIVGLFTLLFLTILAGLLFGGKKSPGIISIRPTPTPLIIEKVQTPAPSGDAVSQIETKLLDLKKQIDDLDVKQSRLQPPSVDFKISF